MYRPQFPDNPHKEFRDEDFVQYFDQNSNLQLANALNLAVGGMILEIPLQLQSDAPFTWRAIQVNGPANFAMRFKDPYGNYLTDDWVMLPLAFSPDSTAPFGTTVIPLEPAIRCPLGSVVWVDILRVS